MEKTDSSQPIENKKNIPTTASIIESSQQSILKVLKGPHSIFAYRLEEMPHIIAEIMGNRQNTLEIPPVSEIESFDSGASTRNLSFRDLSRMIEEVKTTRNQLELVLEHTTELKETITADILLEKTEKWLLEIQLLKFYLLLQKAKLEQAPVSQIEGLYDHIRSLQEAEYGELNIPWAIRMMSTGRTQLLATSLAGLAPELLHIKAFREIQELAVEDHADQDIIGEQLEYLTENLYSQIKIYMPAGIEQRMHTEPDAQITGEEQLRYIQTTLDKMNKVYQSNWKAKLVPGSSYSVSQGIQTVNVPSTTKSVRAVIALIAHEVGVHVLRSLNNPLIHVDYIGYEEGVAVSMQRIASHIPTIALTKIDTQTLLYCIYAVGGSVEDMIVIAKCMDIHKAALADLGFEPAFCVFSYHLKRTLRAADQAPGTTRGIIDYKDIVYPDGLTDFARLLSGINSENSSLASACKKLINASLLAKANFCDVNTILRLQALEIIDLELDELTAVLQFVNADMLESRI